MTLGRSVATLAAAALAAAAAVAVAPRGAFLARAPKSMKRPKLADGRSNVETQRNGCGRADADHGIRHPSHPTTKTHGTESSVEWRAVAT